MKLALTGRTSDRIRTAQIPVETLYYHRPPDLPDARYIVCGSGQGLGNGATRARSPENGHG